MVFVKIGLDGQKKCPYCGSHVEISPLISHEWTEGPLNLREYKADVYICKICKKHSYSNVKRTDK